MLLGILVYAVDVAEVGVVGSLQVWRYEQERVALVGQNVVCGVGAVLKLYAEVVYWRHIALARLHGLRVNECPCGVGVVIQRKFLSLPVLLQDECRGELRLRGVSRYLHALQQVGSYVVGPEVEWRQQIQ